MLSISFLDPYDKGQITIRAYSMEEMRELAEMFGITVKPKNVAVTAYREPLKVTEWYSGVYDLNVNPNGQD